MRAFLAIVIKDLRVRFASPDGAGVLHPAPPRLHRRAVRRIDERCGQRKRRAAGASPRRGEIPRQPRVRCPAGNHARHPGAGGGGSHRTHRHLETRPSSEHLPLDRRLRERNAFRRHIQAVAVARFCGSYCKAGGGLAAGCPVRQGWRSGDVDPAPASAAPAPRAADPIPSGSIDAPSAAATGNAGQIITWALVPLLGLGAGFIGERRRGTMRRIQSTPAPRGIVTAASVAAEMLGALVQICLLIGFGTLAFHLPWFSHPRSCWA